MKLTDLNPRWLEFKGEHVAIMFLCPHCAPNGREQWLTCFFRSAGSLPKDAEGCPGDRELFAAAFREMGYADPENESSKVVSCNPASAWVRVGDDFGSMTITPSIDASASGHWHGFVTAGEIR